jgi:DNA/RNA endonuclease YhcR with UshA esterase domain
MKTRNIFLLALTAIFAASCHTWDEPSVKDGLESFGNKYLKESNVVTVAELKDAFKTEITGGTLKQVTKATQIKVIVTGNDEGSNIYKTLYVADNTGGISISINKGGLFSEAPVGQCMLIELEGLYIGGYGQQPQIGTLYTKDDGSTQVGRMDRYTWQEHYKLISSIKSLSTNPIKTNDMGMLDLDRDFGKVVTLVGVVMKDADGEKVFAPSDGSVKLSGGCANREVANQSTTVYVRTSTYAEFANMVMPVTKVNITGVLSRFANDVQIMPRSLKDIQPYDGLDYESTWTPTEPEGDGSAAKPFNIAAAIAKCQEVGTTTSSEKYYIKGYVVADAEASAQYGNITFELADSKDGGVRFTAYQMAGSDGKKLPSGYKVSKGDEVVICGKVVNYNGSKPETEGQGKSIIVSVNGKDTKGTSVNGGGDNGSGDNGNGDNGNGDNSGSGDTSGVFTRSIDGLTLTLTNPSATASSATATVDFTALGWAHQQEEPSGTTNGVTVALTKGDGTTTPKYWKTGDFDEARMYAKNVLTLTGTKPIAKIVVTCTANGDTPCVGNETLTASLSGNTLTVVNEHSEAKGGVQLRMKNIVITYAQ